MNILFLTPRFPYPPLRGDQVRAYHFLRLLTRRHRITLLSFGQPGDRLPEDLHAACADVLTIPPPRIPVGGLLGAAGRGLPLQTGLFLSSGMARALRHLLARQPFDLIHIELIRLAPYMSMAPGVPIVVDLIDSLALNVRRRRAVEPWPISLLLRLEEERLRRYEREVCRQAEAVLVVSSADRSFIGDLPTLHVVPLGVEAGPPPDDSRRDHRTIILSGNMGYAPNVDAARFFARRVFPLVRAEIPDARFLIVGDRPTSSVRSLGSLPGVTVTGRVPRLRDYMEQATVAVAPLRTGSGVAIKILEALAAATPVVATSLAIGGCFPWVGPGVLVADDPATMARRVVAVLQDPGWGRQLGWDGRHWAETQTWEQAVGTLEQVYAQMVSGSPLVHG